jgi:predicted ATPase
MWLKSVIITKIGPFLDPLKITFEKDLTILTGKNDAGKSTVLNFIKYIYTNASENHLTQNLDISHYQMEAPEIEAVNSQFTFSLNESTNIIATNNKWQVGDEITKVIKSIGGGFVYGTTVREGGNLPQQFNYPHPRLVDLSIKPISSIINLNNLDNMHQRFLRFLFGNDYVDILRTTDQQWFRRQKSMAEKKLEVKFKELFGDSFRLTFELDMDSSLKQLLLRTIDVNDNFTPLHFRGAGLQRMATLMTLLSDLDLDSTPVLIISDEPETSLHADAQKSVRKLLERLSQKPNVQVIYATHSTSMINPLLHNNIRLLQSVKNAKGFSTVRLIENPTMDNFSYVRTQLGWSAADSLMYGPISIIVEGPTEANCIMRIIKKLSDAGIEEFIDAPQLLEQHCFILCAVGDNYPYWVVLTRSQGSTPILFLDGDKSRQVRTADLKAKLENCPVILIDENQEFEDLIPAEIYFKALRLEVGREEISIDAFNSWKISSGNSNINRYMFSKQVERWLDTLSINLDKPSVFLKAIEISDAAQINIKPFKQLVDKIREILPTL